MATPGYRVFKEITNNTRDSHVNAYLETLSGIKHFEDCIRIETPMLWLLEKLRKPETMAELKGKETLPSYLTEQRSFKSIGW